MTSRAQGFVAATSWGARRARRAERAQRSHLVAVRPDAPVRFAAGGSAARDLAGAALVLGASALVWAYVAAAAFQPVPTPPHVDRPAAVEAAR